MQDEMKTASSENVERIELIAKHAEELSAMIQKLNTMLIRGEFDDLKSLLNEIKNRITEIENGLSTLDLE